MAKRGNESKPEAGIVKVVGPLVDSPATVDTNHEVPPASTRAPSGPSFGERVGHFFRFILRLVSLLLILAILSIALYYALPWLNREFIAPVQQNTAQIRELQASQEKTKQQLVNLQTKLETNETAQNKQDKSLTALEKRMGDIEKEVNARTQSLAALEQMQSELQAQNQATSAELDRQINVLKSMELLSRARQAATGKSADQVRDQRNGSKQTR